MNERSHRNRYLVSLTLLAALLPYLVKQYDYYETTGLAALAYSGVIAVAFLAGALVLQDRPVLRRATAILTRSPHFLVYLVLLGLSQYLGGVLYGGASVAGSFRFLGYLLMALLGYIVFPAAIAGNNHPFWKTLAWIGVISAFLGLWVVVTGRTSFLGLTLQQDDLMSALGLYSTRGPFHEPNIYGFVVTLGMVGLLYRLQDSGRRLVPVLLFLMCAAAVLFSWSRGIYLALAVGLLTWLLTGSAPSRKVLFAAAAATVGLIVVLSLENIPVLSGLLQIEIGLSGREVLWPAAMRAIAERPLLGYGLGNLIGPVAAHGGIFNGVAMGAHNSYLDMGVQAGAPLGLAYLLVVGVSWFRLWRSGLQGTERRALSAALAAGFVATLFLSYGLGGASYGALVFTMILGLANQVGLAGPAAEQNQDIIENRMDTYGLT